MKKDNLYYFKKALLLSVPIAAFIIVRGLFEIDFSDLSEILLLIFKGLVAGVITALILGIINIFAKIDTLMKKE